MQRPSWVTAIGILGIILGSLGLLGSVQTVMTPTIMKFQKAMFSNMEKEMERQQSCYGNATTCKFPPSCGQFRRPAPPPIDIFKFMNKMWDAPEWFNTWCIAAGVLGVFVAGFYIFASIWLLLMKNGAVKLFYFAAGTSIAFSITKGVVSVIAMPLYGISMLVWGLVGVIFSAVLIIVVATSDKSAFKQGAA